jgi:predicted ATP-binding protein involved in virulence
MRINEIHIEGFRGIQDLQIKLNPNFNLLIGENGSGKTTILEALTVAIGSFFSGMPGVQGRHIRDNDIRYFKTVEGTYEYAIKTKVDVSSATFKQREIRWYKEREGLGGSNKMGNRSQIKMISDEINHTVKNPNRTRPIELPLLAYYSTARLWKEGRDNKKEEEKESKIKNLPSRYRGYKDALEIKSTFQIMLEWFKSNFQDVAINNELSPQLRCVKTVIVRNIPNAVDVKWVFSKDKISTLYVVLEDQSEIPFYFLSDGYRNLLAIFADIAYRCVTLNPHLGANANSETEGVVLIDELDLHLHPAWQQNIVRNLKETFPRIQFVASTHSPFIIQEMEDDEVYKINSTADNILNPLKGTNRLGIEDIAEDIQDVESPNMSKKREEMFKAAEEYYQLLDSAEKEKNPNKLQELKDRLDSITELYSDDVAYYAFLKQERIARGLK